MYACFNFTVTHLPANVCLYFVGYSMKQCLKSAVRCVRNTQGNTQLMERGAFSITELCIHSTLIVLQI